LNFFLCKIWRYGITLIARNSENRVTLSRDMAQPCMFGACNYSETFNLAANQFWQLSRPSLFFFFFFFSPSLSSSLRLQRPALPAVGDPLLQLWFCLHRCHPPPSPCSLALNAKTFHRLKVLRASAWSKERLKWLFPGVSERLTVPECCQKLVPTLP
jgi:hypothetical protein